MISLVIGVWVGGWGSGGTSVKLFFPYILNSKIRVFNPYFFNWYSSKENSTFPDNLRAEPAILNEKKIIFFETFLWPLLWASFIKTVRGPLLHNKSSCVHTTKIHVHPSVIPAYSKTCLKRPLKNSSFFQQLSNVNTTPSAICTYSMKTTPSAIPVYVFFLFPAIYPV